MSTSTPLPLPTIAGGLHVGGVLLRGAVYALLATFASRYDCGQALLGGVVAGDLAASVLAAVWNWSSDRRAALVELAILAVAFLWVRAWLVWPEDPADRALFGLAAFGVFVARAGGTALTRIGSDHDGWS